MQWVLLTLMSAVLIGINYIFEKIILKKERVGDFLVTYSLIMIFMMLPFVKYVNFNISGKLLAVIIVKAFIVTIASILTTKALKRLEISTVMPMMNLAPLFLVVLSGLFLGEILSAYKIGGILLIIGGAYLLQLKNGLRDALKPFNIRSKYTIYIVIAMLIVSIAAMIDKIILAKIDFFSYLFMLTFTQFLFYSAVQAHDYRGFEDIINALKIGGLWFFLICAIDLIAGIFYLMAVSTPGAYISLIMPIKRLSTLFSTIVGGKMFHDHRLGYKAAACTLMLAGAGLIIF